ncbi:hypothetical protein A8C32_05040 [Flavivirga aquatica]|uniref:Uncharacterized protein n=1 Tax=Flavivirga aquatica TaxID=1849968 RepID=A0A1E5SHH3_9FLAO|nr:hypothetical protein [Flavivirga aquatica]OEJ98571.1 hypothetical protein A8C32_05040 [Flavivirga aquatica]
MKNLILAILFLIGITQSNSQENKYLPKQKIQVGVIMKIGHPEARIYNYIDFPRSNFIIKRGGIIDYKRIPGTKVVIVGVEDKKNGTRLVRIKRADGGRFFGSHPSVIANLEKALSSGELQII